MKMAGAACIPTTPVLWSAYEKNGDHEVDLHPRVYPVPTVIKVFLPLQGGITLLQVTRDITFEISAIFLFRASLE